MNEYKMCTRKNTDSQLEPFTQPGCCIQISQSLNFFFTSRASEMRSTLGIFSYKFSSKWLLVNPIYILPCSICATRHPKRRNGCVSTTDNDVNFNQYPAFAIYSYAPNRLYPLRDGCSVFGLSIHKPSRLWLNDPEAINERDNDINDSN